MLVCIDVDTWKKKGTIEFLYNSTILYNCEADPSNLIDYSAWLIKYKSEQYSPYIW